MTREESREQHDRLVEMLNEQDRLYEAQELTAAQKATLAEFTASMRAKIDHPKPHCEWYEPIVVTKRHLIRIGKHCRVDSFVKLEGGSGLIIGEHVHIASFAHLNIGGGHLEIGDGAAFASHATVVTGGNRPNGVSMSAAAPKEEQILEYKHITIGKNAAVLTGACVRGVNLGEGAILAAMSIATKDIPPFEIWAGVPAKRISDRRYLRDLARAEALPPDRQPSWYVMGKPDPEEPR